MNSDTIISVEHLSKRFLVGHRAAKKEKYVALRDVVSRNAVNMARRTFDLFRGKQMIEGEDIEEFWALRDVSFEVKRGQVLAIIGRNGAGKSTLLKVLSRITEPTEGRAVLRGRVASLLEVGTGFHPELTGRENIFLNGTVLGMKRTEVRRKLDEIVAFAEVEKFLDTPVKRYSSGMYVRLAFAVAAHLEPEILLVDEVLAVGDAEFQKKCLGKMSDVAHGGRTILFVSHNMHSVEKICERVLHLSHGCLAGDYTNVREGIASYLKEGGDNSTSPIWTNPGGECETDYFVPERLEVSSARSGATPDEPLSNHYPIVITVTGTVRKQDPALDIGVSVLANDGELLFFSLAKDEIEDRWPHLAPGLVRLRAKIPPHLLNEGDYRVQVIALINPLFWLLDCEFGASTAAVTFSIRGGLSESPVWNRKRPGILAPILSWENCG